MEPNNYCFSPNCQKPHGDQVLSPPLTPALSPYKRDMNYRRASTNDYHHSYWSSQQQQQQEQQRAMSFSDQSGSSRKRPIKQNKHACNYPRCFWSFKRFEHLKRHMLVHTGERPHGCPFPGCGKRFSRTDNFHAHYRTHSKKSLQKTDDDFVRTPSSPGMNSNNSAIETPIRQPNLSFSSSGRSILTNNQPLPPPPIQQQPSNHNQYSYPHSAYYHDQQHMHHLSHQQPLPPPPPQPLHNQQRPSSNSSDKQHVCTHHQCQRRFKRLEHLKRHMRIHTMERPFHCSFPGCQKAFSRSDNLTQHSKTHLRSNENRGSRNNSTSSTSSSSSPLSSSSSASPSSFYTHHPPSTPTVLRPESLGFNDYIRPSSTSPSSPYNKHRQDPPPPSLHPILHWQQHTGDANSGNINC